MRDLQPAMVASHPHAGTIVSEQPNQVKGTDATASVPLTDGQVTVFAAIDHCTAECLGIRLSERRRPETAPRRLSSFPTTSTNARMRVAITPRVAIMVEGPTTPSMIKRHMYGWWWSCLSAECEVSVLLYRPRSTVACTEP
jgi:hypothetical protein